MGNWSEATQSGYGLEIDPHGALLVRIGAGHGRVVELSSPIPLSTRRWYLAASAFDAERGILTLWQEPLTAHDFHPEHPVIGTTPAAILFGAERTGLTNDELESAHVLIRIPANEAYTSLNLSMAVQLVSYEIFRATR